MAWAMRSGGMMSASSYRRSTLRTSMSTLGTVERELRIGDSPEDSHPHRVPSTSSTTAEASRTAITELTRISHLESSRMAFGAGGRLGCLGEERARRSDAVFWRCRSGRRGSQEANSSTRDRKPGSSRQTRVGGEQGGVRARLGKCDVSPLAVDRTVRAERSRCDEACRADARPWRPPGASACAGGVGELRRQDQILGSSGQHRSAGAGADRDR